MASVLNVDQIKNASGTSAMTIDSSGRVSRSVIPAWRIGLSGNQTISQGSSLADVTFDNLYREDENGYIEESNEEDYYGNT